MSDFSYEVEQLAELVQITRVPEPTWSSAHVEKVTSFWETCARTPFTPLFYASLTSFELMSSAHRLTLRQSQNDFAHSHMPAIVHGIVDRGNDLRSFVLIQYLAAVARDPVFYLYLRLQPHVTTPLLRRFAELDCLGQPNLLLQVGQTA